MIWKDFGPRHWVRFDFQDPFVCLYWCNSGIHVQYSDIMRSTVLHIRHQKVSQSVPFFMHCKTVTILLRIRVRGHFVMSITNNHESHYVTVLGIPLFWPLLVDLRSLLFGTFAISRLLQLPTRWTWRVRFLIRNMFHTTIVALKCLWAFSSRAVLFGAFEITWEPGRT